MTTTRQDLRSRNPIIPFVKKAGRKLEKGKVRREIFPISDWEEIFLFFFLFFEFSFYF